MKIQLVDDWKKFYKWGSMWILTLMGAAHELYEQLQMAQQFIPPTVFRHGMAILCVLAMAFRVIKQKPNDAPVDPAQKSV